MVDINNNIPLRSPGIWNVQDFLCTKWPILTSGIARCKLYCSVQISSISVTASPVIDDSNYNKVQFLCMIYVITTTCYVEYCIALKLHYPLPALLRSFFYRNYFWTRKCLHSIQKLYICSCTLSVADRLGMAKLLSVMLHSMSHKDLLFTIP